MSRLSSSAPQIGAALAAGLMILSAVAFQMGIGEDPNRDLEPAPAAEAKGDGQLFFIAAAGPSRVPEVQISVASEPSTVSASIMPSSAGVRAPQLAVILDDVADLATAESIWALPVPVTVSVLPYAQQSRLIASRAGGREVFLHLPMEPVGLQDPGPYALTKTLEGESMAARLRWALSQVPDAAGFNNHMGSRLTADESAMTNLFDALAEERDHLVFVDSLTHPASVARDTAVAAGFKAFNRDIFLDHDPDRASIDAQIDAALVRAQEAGSAIAIGHPRAQTLAALETLAVRAEAAGVEVVPVRALRAD